MSAATSAKEFIEQVKKEPGKINCASAGAGTTHHLAMEMFRQRTGPPLDERGIANFEVWAWQRLLVPTATPNDIIGRLNAE